MPVPYNPDALAYWAKCPCCHEVHVAINHHIAIFGSDWHKKDCVFINPGGLYVTFSAYPIMHDRHKYFRCLTPEFQQFFKDERDKRLKLIQTAS